MIVHKLRKNGRLYVKLTLGMTLFIVATLIATSSIYYFNYARVLQKEVFEKDLSSLRSTSQAVEGTTDSAMSLSFQIYRNSAIAKLMYYKEPNEFDVQGAMVELNNYLNNIPFIESIYVYNPGLGDFFVASRNGEAGILTEEELKDRGIIDILDRNADYKPLTPIPRRVNQDDKSDPVGIYSYLCFDAINFDRKITSAVIVNVSASWINRDIGLGSDYAQSRTYIRDDHGRFMTANSLEPLNDDMRDLALQPLIDASAAYKITEVNGIKSLVSYTAPDQFSWQYIRVTPYDIIMNKIDAVRWMTIQIAAGILVVGILLTWLVAHVLYVPFNKIVTRMKDLESEKRESSFTVRQNALRKLLQIQLLDPVNQLERLKRLGIQFDYQNPYRLVYIRIDRFLQLKEQNDKDLLTYKFAIMNIGSEIGSKHYNAETVDVEEDGILLLLNCLEPNEPEHPEWLDPMLQEIQKVCMEYFSISLTLSVSPVSSNPTQLHALYKDVKNAALRRFFLGSGAIVHASEAESLQPSEYAYPIGKEKRMIDAIMTGKTDEAKDSFSDILTETRSFPLSVTESALARLAITLNNLVNELQKNGSLPAGLDASLRVPDSRKFETLDEVTDAYYRLLDELKVRVSEKKSGKHEELARKINELIETRYADPNLSLNLIAEELGLSTFHISRVYRQQTLSTIVDVINMVRMDKAKELLLEDNRPIGEIAELTGYTNSSYFHRMFKKFNGVTPTDYRKSNQATSSN